MYLYHFFDKSVGPFKNLSDLSIEQAKDVLERIKVSKPSSQSASRHDKYVEYRRNCERIIQTEFEKIGGKIYRTPPHYMVVEFSPWLSTWFENCDFIKIPIEEFDLESVSFTYGDSMPTFSPTINDGKEYRHKIYNYSEITKLIDKYGFPQLWNDDGLFGPERYIEAHIWNDDPIKKYM